MIEKRWLYFALGVTTVISIGAVANQLVPLAPATGLALSDTGITFPDGSVQATAAVLPAKTAVQVSASAGIDAFQFCSGPQAIYTVAAGKRLAIEWVSVQSVAIDLADPVEVDIITKSGVTSIYHPLVRLQDSEFIADSLFRTQIWNSPVRLYSDAGNLQINACRDLDTAQTHSVMVTLSGHLVDVP